MKKHVITKVFIDKAGRECARLGEKGFCTKFIARHVGLTEGQVNYRLKMADIRRAAYRNGETESAKWAIKAAASKELMLRIEKLLREIDTVARPNAVMSISNGSIHVVKKASRNQNVVLRDGVIDRYVSTLE